jgi:hypothetical protein
MERDMRVRIDESRHDGPVAEIDDRGILWDVDFFADDDPVTLDQDQNVFTKGIAFTVEKFAGFEAGGVVLGVDGESKKTPKRYQVLQDFSLNYQAGSIA